jgi:hypothetical protein
VPPFKSLFSSDPHAAVLHATMTKAIAPSAARTDSRRSACGATAENKHFSSLPALAARPPLHTLILNAFCTHPRWEARR